SDSPRPRSQDGPKKDIWSSMLDGVSSGKRLPEKSLLVLGGTPETQKDFLESLTLEENGRRRPPDRGRKPPIANQFALGYTYQDVLDADHEDILARLSLYLLTDPSPSFTPLLAPLLTPRTLPNMLIVILLDWAAPWTWLRQLREWIRVLRTLIASLSDECKDVMEENILSWRDRGRRLNLDGTPNAAASGPDGDVNIPVGPGEWDEPLGIPLCVVCQNADKMEGLERERGWKDELFDYVMQYLRTILLKHGASLIYTMPTAPGGLQTLVHASLGIQSTLKRESLKHNVIDREKVLVPPNWDSWGKIRILREGFDAEAVSEAWSVDIQTPSQRQDVQAAVLENGDMAAADAQAGAEADGTEEEELSTSIAMYEEVIKDPGRESALAQGLPTTGTGKPSIEVISTDNQAFLSSQLEVLEKLRAEDERTRLANQSTREKQTGHRERNTFSSNGRDDTGSGVVEEHIGPVQFNMGGIQVDADDMLKRLKDREANRDADGDDASVSSPTDIKTDNDSLSNFFASLVSKTGSPR
ncbi:hypothetical protein K490DRAFT_3258, partial [Saccharata proteae CBS 121410]